MKLRYLFPLVFLALLGASFVIPQLGDFLYVLIAPVSIPILYLSIVFNGPRDTFPFPEIATIGVLYLLGLVGDRVLGWLKSQPETFERPSKLGESKTIEDSKK